MINYTLDYEFAKEGNFTINLFVNKLLSINFVNKNKQISKEGPATNGNGNHSMVITANADRWGFSTEMAIGSTVIKINRYESSQPL